MPIYVHHRDIKVAITRLFTHLFSEQKDTKHFGII